MGLENIPTKCQWKDPKFILAGAIIILVGAVMIISILRERIVNQNNDLTTVIGRGKISYQPDIAVVNLGVQIDKAPTAGEALGKLNESMGRVISSVKALGIPEEDIQTQSYSLYPHYDYQGDTGGVTIPSGYDANQQVSVKLKSIDKNPGLSSKVIEETSKAGANQVVGISFDVSNLEELKQKARIEAINDARAKAIGMAQAAGVRRLGKVVSWYENIVKSPDAQNYSYGLGGAEKSASSVSPQIPTGTEEIIIEMGLNYRVK